MDNFLELLNSWIWSPALVILCLITGLYFSIGLRFVQVRRIKTMARLLLAKDNKRGTGVTSFQAFSLALSGRVGTGNVVGVATAIGFGGPGAIVWMWIVAFFGAGTAFAESTLSQIYKVEHDGQYRGGPSYYIEKGLKSKFFSALFAAITIIAAGFLLPSVQSNGIAASISDTFEIENWIIGVSVVILISLIIFGGVKRIATSAQFIAPIMAMIYITISIIILIFNLESIPSAFKDMIESSIGLKQAFSGIMGCTISMGVKRGLYSNEAGQGSGAIVSAAAGVSHPVKQGLVQAFSVYVDTLMVCTATAIIILACHTYNVFDPQGHIIFRSPVAELGEPGVSYTTAALATLLGNNMAGVIISISLFFFSFTTIMAYYYYAETSVVYLFNKGKIERIIIFLLRIALLVSVFFGTMLSTKTAWMIGDMGVGMMTWFNIIAILLLSPIVFRTLRSYERQEKEGKEPTFDPDEVGARNTDYWKKNEQTEISSEKQAG